MSLYLDKILNLKTGVISLTIPDPSGNGGTSTLKGFLTDNPVYSLQNNWGSIFPDFNALGEVSQLAGSANIISWLSSSQAGWKGTEPLTISTEFYVISYRKGRNIKKEVAKLVKMGAVHSSDGLLGLASVTVHGGYSNNYFNDNNTFITNIEDANSSLSKGKSGLIKMEIGDQLRLNSLLLSDVQISPSTVQVDEGIPLYIKVSANFRTYRTLITQDIDYMYNI